MTAALVDRLQTALGSSYRIERELGRGGMATVLLARDVRHEICTTAALDHPNILPVFDSGEAAGLLPRRRTSAPMAW